MRTSSSNVTKPKVYEYTEFELADTPAFQSYAKQIKQFVWKAKVPVSIGDIKRGLGEAFNPRWFFLAIEYNSDCVTEVEGVVAKYIKRVKPKLDLGTLAPMGISPKAFEQD